VNTLWHGDNLGILRNNTADESVDLIYLDPPFNSNRDYNVLFKEKSGAASPSQMEAFTDTWTWDQAAVAAMDDIALTAPAKVVRTIEALRDMIGDNDLMAYLAMMCQRLVELHRVLKATGSLYLHCDPTASHYLKIILDAIFEPQNFRNEVIWKRTAAHSAARRWGDVHDVILFYTRSRSFTWNEVLLPHTEGYSSRYKNRDASGRVWTDDNLTAPGIRHGDSGAIWRGCDPTAKGVHWKASAKVVESLVGAEVAKMLSTTQKLDVLDDHGFIHWPTSRTGGQGFPRFKRYLSAGTVIQDVITDIPPLNSQAQERLGYPTQKPLALLERIISASSNSGDVVLDPFCGCGTAVAAAEKLGRQWIGIDITYLAISVMKQRLQDHFPGASFDIQGVPSDLTGARALFEESPYNFQWWAVDALGINARPFGGKKKGSDHGIDGEFFYSDERGRPVRGLIQVKGGKTNSGHIRDFRGTMERENVDLGIFVCLQDDTKDMRGEAASAGFVHSGFSGRPHPRLQILTIEDLFNGVRPDIPHGQTAHQQAPRIKRKAEQGHTIPIDLNAKPITVSERGD